MDRFYSQSKVIQAAHLRTHTDFHCKVWLQTVGQEQRSFDTVCHFMTDHSISQTNYVTSQCLNFFIREMKMILAIYLLIYLTKLL